MGDSGLGVPDWEPIGINTDTARFAGTFDGDGSESGKYWKEGTADGKSLPKLWWEK
ncbi:MAG: hypothetical protein Ta2F_08460 [Termitinemataceae bacterium]|nr:MAG: hypothetical protein Ta2F_08460 [Termitinemataceae bacterium]